MARPATFGARAKGMAIHALKQRIRELERALKAIVDSAEDGTRFHYFVTRASVIAARQLIQPKEKGK